jgi:predicted CoA-binding protein
MSGPVEVLRTYSSVAVVGASADADKPAHGVPAFLRSAGWRVVPVSPKGGELFGEPVIASLEELDGPIEVVDVFRLSEEAPAVARQAVAAGAKAVWLQLGITSPEARRIAEDAGLDDVEDACLMVESKKHGITKP